MLKKFFITLFIFILSCSTTLAADVSRLYTVTETAPSDITQVLAPYLKRKFPTLINSDNSFIIEDKNKKYYYVILLSNKGEHCYFYYMSNNDDESFRKDILTLLKNNDFKSKKVVDSKLKSFFYGEAYTALAHSNLPVNMRSRFENSENSTPVPDEIIRADAIEYDFSDEAQAKFSGAPYTSNTNENIVKIEQRPALPLDEESPIELNPVTQNPAEKNVVRLPKIESSFQGSAFNPDYRYEQNAGEQTYQKPGTLTGSVIYIQDGATFTAALLSDISSDSLMNNDRISAELDEDWVYNGLLIAPAGSILSGQAIDMQAASYAMKNGQIGLLFDEIMTPDGNVIPLKTNKVFIVGNSTRALNVTKRIAGGAAAGLVLSAVSIIFGADPVTAIIAGTSIGAGSGAISAMSSKGEEIMLVKGSPLKIMLTEPLTVQLYRQN